MGNNCTKRSAVDISPGERAVRVKGVRDSKLYSAGSHINYSGEGSSDKSVSLEVEEVQLSKALLKQKSKSSRSKMAGTIKVSEMSSRLGRVGSFGLGKAVDVLDNLGSSLTSLNVGGNFATGVGTKGNKISILAFEVANTIVKGANLMLSLSDENLKHLKTLVLHSEAVQLLVSEDMEELLMIAATDKREELKVFSAEVVRFGNRCKDPQWHNLDRYFDKLGTNVMPQKQLKEEAPRVMQQLMTLVQYTAELYHELQVLDRLEQDCRRKQEEEENSNVIVNGTSLQILKQELKNQRKQVKNLKKRSLWSKILEEVMEKLVDIVHALHLEIEHAFHGSAGDRLSSKSVSNHERLGPAGLALHYANIISQIDTIVTRSHYVPSSTRDALYQALPPRIKASLRTKLQSFQPNYELDAPHIKAELEKTLRWLLPVINNTTKAHHGFGWVGEWANLGPDLNQRLSGQTSLIRLETLHHADKETTESYILDLLVLLHHLISLSKLSNRSPIKSPIRSPTPNNISSAPSGSIHLPRSRPSKLTREDEEMLREVPYRKLTPGISKSQELSTVKSAMRKHGKLTKSCSHSPSSEIMKEIAARRAIKTPFVSFTTDKMKAMDVVDRVDSIGKI